MSSLTDFEQRIVANLRQVAAATAVPPVPTDRNLPDRARRARRRRFGTIAAVSTLLVAGGYAAAAAAADGRLPFPWVFTGSGSQKAQASVVATFPVPGGATSLVEIAPTKRGDQPCVFRMSVLPEGTKPPPNKADGCRGPNASRFASLGAGGVQQQQGAAPYLLFAEAAGPATSAFLRVNGEQRPLQVIGGYIVGWMPLNPAATIVGVGADGHIVGTVSEAELTGIRRVPLTQNGRP